MVRIKEIPKSDLFRIKSLWEGLNEVHFNDSVYFTEHYKNFTFEKRAAGWNKLLEEHILILVAENEDEKLIGYCVSTIDENNGGEIDSLFVEPAFRGQQTGRELVVKSLNWLKENSCNPIRLAVSYGHESVVGFYEKLGFYPRLSILEWRP
jgi:diamine N-acetyltransferase